MFGFNLFPMVLKSSTQPKWFGLISQPVVPSSSFKHTILPSMFSFDVAKSGNEFTSNIGFESLSKCLNKCF